MNKELKRLSIAEILPYERNPRKNDAAVDDVAESIRQTGYIAPIIVDEDYVILAGHTRFKALKQLGYTETEVMVITGMTEEQKKKYRLLDNKTSEKAGWDYELLDWELEELDFEGYDFGFNIIDDLYAEDENEQKSVTLKSNWQIIIDCENEQDMQTKYETITEMGIECRTSTL